LFIRKKKKKRGNKFVIIKRELHPQFFESNLLSTHPDPISGFLSSPLLSFLLRSANLRIHRSIYTIIVILISYGGDRRIDSAFGIYEASICFACRRRRWWNVVVVVLSFFFQTLFYFPQCRRSRQCRKFLSLSLSSNKCMLDRWICL